MQQSCFIRKPKKILRPWLWRAQNRHGKRQKYWDYGDPNAKESLFMGELSDGRRDPKYLEPVPKGFLAVYVGPEQRRFVIPMAYLSMPNFRVLMDNVADEYGYEQEGGLEFPCEEEEFQEILVRCLEMHQMNKKRSNNNISKKKF